MTWTTLLRISSLLFWAAIVWALFFQADTRNVGKVVRDRVEFAPNRVFLWAEIAFAVRMGVLAFGFLKHGGANPWDLITGAALGLGAFAILFSLPGTVLVTEGGMEEVRWLRRNKRVGWDEIVEINTGEKSRTVTITARDGTKIVHSRQMSDRQRFLLELKKHCGENLPPDFPREPVGSSSDMREASGRPGGS